jgi:hypothetical protein
MLEDIKSEDISNYDTQPSTSVKEGVSELFESNPELANIGTPQQYSQYLDSIFPDSKVKDIVYHGGKKGIEYFDKSKLLSGEGANVYGKGFYFTDNRETAIFSYEQITSRMDPQMASWVGRENLDNDNATYPILLNIKNPFLWDISKEEGEELGVVNSAIYNETSNKSEIKKGDYGNHDSVLHITQGQEGLHERGENHWIVPEPEQIHILGNRQDIEGFKNFLSQSNVKSTNNILDFYNKLTEEQKKKIGTLEDLNDQYNEIPFQMTEEEFINNIKCNL